MQKILSIKAKKILLLVMALADSKTTLLGDRHNQELSIKNH